MGIGGGATSNGFKGAGTIGMVGASKCTCVVVVVVCTTVLGGGLGMIG